MRVIEARFLKSWNPSQASHCWSHGTWPCKTTRDSHHCNSYDLGDATNLQPLMEAKELQSLIALWKQSGLEDAGGCQHHLMYQQTYVLPPIAVQEIELPAMKEPAGTDGMKGVALREACLTAGDCANCEKQTYTHIIYIYIYLFRERERWSWYKWWFVLAMEEHWVVVFFKQVFHCTWFLDNILTSANEGNTTISSSSICNKVFQARSRHALRSFKAGGTCHVWLMSVRDHSDIICIILDEFGSLYTCLWHGSCIGVRQFQPLGELWLYFTDIRHILASFCVTHHPKKCRSLQ